MQERDYAVLDSTPPTPKYPSIAPPLPNQSEMVPPFLDRCSGIAGQAPGSRMEIPVHGHNGIETSRGLDNAALGHSIGEASLPTYSSSSP